jgi:predicted short-subunit dehydrogenase-like oxidoreductase (DUF2520 family)
LGAELAKIDSVAGAIVVHFAGVIGTAPLTDHLADVAALHPVQACPDVETAIRRLPGSAWGVTTTAGKEDWGSRFVRTLGGEPVPVAENDRVLWHAAAVTTSNGIAALLRLGEELLDEIGVSRPLDVLGPLAAGAVVNARSGGGGGRTLTGPVVRGDLATVEMHLRDLKSRAPELLSRYLQVTRSILDSAAAAGRIDEERMRALQVLLSAVADDVPGGVLR